MIQYSPFRHEHNKSSRLLSLASGRTAREHGRILMGDRRFGWPMMALRTSFSMGAVRHALAQRVVAGTMTVFRPITPQTRPAAAPGDDLTRP